MLGSVELLADQCSHAWEDASKIVVPDAYRKVKKVIMCGMGGSGLGARVIESVFSENLKIPLVRINDYSLPDFADEETLVICSSYSGETEETLANAKQSIEKKTKWMVIGAGNTLIKMAQDKGVPFYHIVPKYNPSNQPRMAIGYSVVGQLILAAKAGVIKFDKEDVEKLTTTMKNILASVKVEIPQDKNEAKKLATLMKDKIVAFIASGHLVGPMHVVDCQINENAKNFSADFQIPELNHHLMEGLTQPDINKRHLLTFFAKSSLYSDRIKQRVEFTEEVFEKNGLETYAYKLISKTKLEQAFELIQFGAYANFYLAILYDQNPGPIPWVDYFKERLGQPLGK